MMLLFVVVTLGSCMDVKWILSRTGLSTHWKERLVTTWRGTKSSVISLNKQGRCTACTMLLFDWLNWLGRAILGNFSTDQMVIELFEI